MPHDDSHFGSSLLCRISSFSMAARARALQLPPVPLRRLILVWLAEGSLDSGWRSEILGTQLLHLLGALSPGCVVLLFLGWTDTFSLQNASVEIRAILLQTTDIVQDDRRRLSAIYRGFPHVRR